MVTGLRNASPDDHTTFCSGFTLNTLKMSTNIVTRPRVSAAHFKVDDVLEAPSVTARFPDLFPGELTHPHFSHERIREEAVPLRLPQPHVVPLIDRGVGRRVDRRRG